MKYYFLILPFLFTTSIAHSACEGDLKRQNVLYTATFTMLSSWVNSKVFKQPITIKNSFDSFTGGALAGYGFWKAKELAGSGKVKTGMGVAQLSASVVRNLTYNYKPFDYIQYGLGPFTARVATPYNERPLNKLTLEFNPREMFLLLDKADTIHSLSVKDGILFGETKNPIDGTKGRANGSLVRISPNYINDDTTWNHESIHIIQNMQLNSFFSFHSIEWSSQKGKFFDSGIHISILPIIKDTIQDQLPYHQRWSEIEAARLTENAVPVGGHEECLSTLGATIQIAF